MCAFEAELYAIGYRFYSNDKKEHKKQEDFIGPIYKGKCVCYCSSTLCVACPSNNRISEEQIQNAIDGHNKHTKLLISVSGKISKRVINDRLNFIELFPQYSESLYLNKEIKQEQILCLQKAKKQ